MKFSKKRITTLKVKLGGNILQKALMNVITFDAVDVVPYFLGHVQQFCLGRQLVSRVRIPVQGINLVSTNDKKMWKT